MSDEELKHFLDGVAAATIANKAILTLVLAGAHITPENAARTYGRWISPNSPHFEDLITAIHAQVLEMMDTAEALFPSVAGRARAERRAIAMILSLKHEAFGGRIAENRNVLRSTKSPFSSMMHLLCCVN